MLFLKLNIFSHRMPSLDDIRDSGQTKSKNSIGSLFDEDGAFDMFKKHGLSGLDKKTLERSSRFKYIH